MLRVRLKEHLADKRRTNALSPLGKHKIEAHNGGEFDVKCIILSYEAEIVARKSMEAAWISVRNPSMNNRNECLSIATELLPYLSICELQPAHI